MLAIKLQRVGKKHQPGYRFVVAPKKSKMAGPPVEDLGSYNPFSKVAALRKERVLHWIKVGAQPTVTVHNLLIKQGIVSAPTKAIRMRKQKAAETPVAAKAELEAAKEAVKKEEPKAEAPTAEPTVSHRL